MVGEWVTVGSCAPESTVIARELVTSKHWAVTTSPAWYMETQYYLQYCVMKSCMLSLLEVLYTNGCCTPVTLRWTARNPNAHTNCIVVVQRYIVVQINHGDSSKTNEIHCNKIKRIQSSSQNNTSNAEEVPLTATDIRNTVFPPSTSNLACAYTAVQKKSKHNTEAL